MLQKDKKRRNRSVKIKYIQQRGEENRNKSIEENSDELWSTIAVSNDRKTKRTNQKQGSEHHIKAADCQRTNLDDSVVRSPGGGLQLNLEALQQQQRTISPPPTPMKKGISPARARLARIRMINNLRNQELATISETCTE